MSENVIGAFRHGRAARVLRVLCWIFLGLGLFILGFLLLVWFLTYHPAPVENAAVTNRPDAPLLSRAQPFSVLNWNVQYMAGKNYVFFYDLLDGSGPDIRPRRVDIDATTREVARVIGEKRPDFILIQELDDGARRTDGEDQLAKLLALLPPEYGSHATAWYWKAAFVPHPKVWGRAGVKLAVISRFRLASATRHQLPLMPDWWVVQQFNFKRAVLEVRVPLAEGGDLALMTTHLDAFAQGTDTMERQVGAVLKLLATHDSASRPFVLGGDFNLLPDRAAYDRLGPPQRAYFKPETELARLRAQYASIPSAAHTQGPDFAKWYTHFPNDPRVTGPDRTIDYLFLSPRLTVEEAAVLSEGTLRISDHFPLFAKFRLP
ncbi:endonuclease/exonuclease/phosphatase family protein [Myxococcota bacterium]|nr:endonuclease/exonuclease/phosphatase family protein [Myxococcota bacterium]MBU1510975.1 endonuclease/exonuclease/phosphatase family protein [Myxococcota bacterium]